MKELLMRQQLLKKFGEEINITRIETGATAVGVPDLHIRTKDNDVWVELKQVNDPIPHYDNGVIKIPFRAGQFRWIKRHREMGGKVLLIVTKEAGWPPYEEWSVFGGYAVTKEYTRSTYYGLADFAGQFAELPISVFDYPWDRAEDRSGATRRR